MTMQIGWNQSNLAYILTHSVSSIDWALYKYPLPEHVYDVYMKYWGNVEFTAERVNDTRTRCLRFICKASY